MMTSDYLNETQNLVHPDWEVVDPRPDIHALFTLLDEKFFRGKLSCVKLKWSNQSSSYQGSCYQVTNRRKRSDPDEPRNCGIRLNRAVLNVSRKYLVETLLHQMVHAYYFVLGKLESTRRHGPIFERKMNRINKQAGTNITVSLGS